MNDQVAVLIKRQYQGEELLETRREVLCSFRSIGMKEFYQANASDFHPELKLVLADYLDYENEKLVDYEGQRYRVVRTYRAGQELEIVLAKAPAEDGEPDV